MGRGGSGVYEHKPVPWHQDLEEFLEVPVNLNLSILEILARIGVECFSGFKMKAEIKGGKREDIVLIIRRRLGPPDHWKEVYAIKFDAYRSPDGGMRFARNLAGPPKLKDIKNFIPVGLWIRGLSEEQIKNLFGLK